MNDDTKNQLLVGDILEAGNSAGVETHEISRVSEKRAYSKYGCEFKREYKSIHMIVKLKTSKWDHKFFSLKLKN